MRGVVCGQERPTRIVLIYQLIFPLQSVGCCSGTKHGKMDIGEYLCISGGGRCDCNEVSLVGIS